MIKNRGFSRDARKQGLTDEALCKAVTEIERGLIDARLGGFLIKKRITKGNSGKSGGFRTILAHREGDRIVCLYVFGKGDRDNIEEPERLAYLKLGDQYMALSDAKLSALVLAGTLIEVEYNGPEEDE